MNTIPYASLLLAVFLIYVPRGVVAREQAKQPEGYDNATPRAQIDKLSARGLRAQGAHMNSFEALTLFAPAVLACEVRRVSAASTAALCLTFIAVRVIYLGLYLGNKPSARSAVWGLGLLSTLGLYVLAVLGP
jgi:uncharacterized MAPEG superfamily protein